ncbi:PqqD family protein [Streptomyces sp. NPDC096339]|uniref:PqqD family protein n=1 Tax=Streptomyces sp. NPDC096339 TaxID=3366086 RepID=UPI00382DA657
MADHVLTDESVPRVDMAARTRKYRGKLYIAVEDRALELDETAESIFRKIDGRSTVRAIGEGLAAEYAIPVDDAVADAAEFIASLIDHGVVEAGS